MTRTSKSTRHNSTRLSALSLLLTLTACGSGELDYAELEDTVWELTELTVMGGYDFSPDVPGDYTLRFESDSRLRGKSDCNTFTGQWSADETFAVSEFDHTRTMCLSGSIHNFYVLYLPQIVNLVMEDDLLVASTTTEGVRLAFQQAMP